MISAKALLTISLGLFLATIMTPAQQPPATSGSVHEVQVTAKKYQFTPEPIQVKKGERVRLFITAVDHDHGFQLDEFRIKEKIKKGQTATVEILADHAGTFPFHCSTFCGLGHHGMKGTLVVEE